VCVRNGGAAKRRRRGVVEGYLWHSACDLFLFTVSFCFVLFHSLCGFRVVLADWVINFLIC
jgi:hypothetical protein